MQSVLKRFLMVGLGVTASVALAAGPASAGDVSNSAVEVDSSRSVASTEGTAGVASAGAEGSFAAARGSVIFSVGNVRCTGTTVKFTAVTRESGFSGVQQFAQRAKLQSYNGSRWVDRTGFKVVRSQRFPDDSRNFSFTLNWTGTHPNNGASWREVWQGAYLDGFGSTLAQTRQITATCF